MYGGFVLRKFNLKNRLLMIFAVIVLGITGLYGCGKKDGIVSKEFKVIYRNKTEAIIKFGENNELTVTSAQGKYNAGQEFKDTYQLKEVDGKEYLLLPEIDKDILYIQGAGNPTARISRYNSKDNKEWYVYQLVNKEDKVIMYNLSYKKGKEDKFKDVDDLNMLGIGDNNDINSILEPISTN